MFEALKGRLEASKAALESKGLRVNIKEKMMTSSENTGMVTTVGKFPWAVCRKGVDSNSIICRFCRCCVNKRCTLSDGFADVGCIRDVVVLEANWKRKASLNVRHV